MNNTLDTLIIGAGPIGLACGIEASRQQLSYLIVEKGCLVNSLFHFPTNMTFFSTSERLELGNVPFVAHGDKPTRREALEYYRRVQQHWQLAVHTYEKAIAIQPQGALYEVKTTKRSYDTRSIIIATGFYDLPNLLGIEGEQLPKVKHYFDEPHPYADQNIVVIGGGNSAVDVALECYRKGARVTMIIRQPQLKESVKYWVRPDIDNRIAEGAITAYFNSRLVKIEETSVWVQSHLEAPFELANNFVLAMTGYRPDYDWLKKVGIAIETDSYQTPVHHPKTLETNLPNVYLAGVVCGGLKTNQWFIENARQHAKIIMKQLMVDV